MDKDMAVLIIHTLINQLGVHTEQDQGTGMVERERETAESGKNEKLNDRGSIKEQSWSGGGGSEIHRSGVFCVQ